MTDTTRSHAASALERDYMPAHWPNVSVADVVARWDVIKTAVPISGLFDLQPFLQLSLNRDLRLDAASARRNNSPLLSPA